jgi:hypothetical protein
MHYSRAWKNSSYDACYAVLGVYGSTAAPGTPLLADRTIAPGGTTSAASGSGVLLLLHLALAHVWNGPGQRRLHLTAWLFYRCFFWPSKENCDLYICNTFLVAAGVTSSLLKSLRS